MFSCSLLRRKESIKSEHATFIPVDVADAKLLQCGTQEEREESGPAGTLRLPQRNDVR